MTLLDDLGSLDLSGVLDAKAEISLTVDSDDLAALVDAGAVTRVLGDLGVAIQVAVEGFEEPERLVEPVLGALRSLLDGLETDLPVQDYVDAVAEAARVVAGLVGNLTGDPHAIALGGGAQLGATLGRLGGPFADHAAAVGGGLGRFRALVQSVEQGLPSDPTAFAAAALEILLPFPLDPLDAVREWAAQVGEGLEAVAVDPRLGTGLVEVLAGVRVAAEAGDPAALEAALARLRRVRAHTVDQVGDALRRMAGAVSALPVSDGLEPVLALRSMLDGADDTVFDLLDGWREVVGGLRGTVAGLDTAAAAAHLEELLDTVETSARELIWEGVDGSVEQLRQWLRNLLREIPVRPLRQRLSRAIAEAGQAVADADLDGPVDTVRGGLDELSRLLTEADPAALVQDAVAELEQVVSEALDTLETALGGLTAAIESVADQAGAVLRRAVDGLRDFRGAVDEITAALGEAGILETAREIARTLDELQEQVSTLLSAAPLPDALREAVEQLISTLEGIDLDEAIGAPLHEVAERLRVPDDVASTVRDGLEAVAEAVQSLVPDDVVADLEARMGAVLDEIQSLDLTQLTAGMGELLDDAARVFEGVRLAELVAPAGEIFEKAVGAVDRLHPRVVLRPAIDLYAQILGAVPVPDPQTMATRIGTVTAQAGESAARAAAEPARAALGGDSRMPPAGERPRGGLGPAAEEPPDDLRPGDVVRLAGFLPGTLRAALADLDDGPAGEVLAEVSGQLTATAGTLRTVRDRLAGLDGVLEAALDGAFVPVTSAQADAQLALTASPLPGVEVEASLSLVASVGPAALEAELAGELDLVSTRLRGATRALSGALADQLDAAADLLDAVVPAGVLADVDALLDALDPEPIAAEVDALFTEVVDAMPAFLTAADAQLRGLPGRIRRLLADLGPGALMQRYVGVLDVVREELALLDPGRLADELGAVHQEVRAALVAYDPAALAGELDALLAQVAAGLHGLDPAGLVPDLSGLEAQVARVGDILPVNALAGIGTQLTDVGEELRALDVEGLLEAVNTLAPEASDAILALITSVRDEIVDLLASIRYASSGASASVPQEVG